MKLTVQFPV